MNKLISSKCHLWYISPFDNVTTNGGIQVAHPIEAVRDPLFLFNYRWFVVSVLVLVEIC